MNRFTRFARNAGLRGLVMTAALAAVMVYLLLHHANRDHFGLLLAALVVPFFAMCAIRNLLVAHHQVAQRIMTVALIAAVVFSFLSRFGTDSAAESVGVKVASAAFIGTYMGCYFWLLSDPRIGRGED